MANFTSNAVFESENIRSMPAAATTTPAELRSPRASLLAQLLLNADKSSLSPGRRAVSQVIDHLRSLDAQDQANSLATLLAAVRDESQGQIDADHLVRKYHAGMEDQLSTWPTSLEVAAEAPVRAPRLACDALYRAFAQRATERRRMRLEAGLAGIIGWYGGNRCIHIYPRLIVAGTVLSQSRQVTEQRMTDRVTGKRITWEERAWNGRRVEERFTLTQEVDVETSLETHRHALANARRVTIADALTRVAMPQRIRRCLEVIAGSDYAHLYYVAVGDLYDATVVRESLGRKRTTIEKTGATVWYACEPALVFAPLGVVEAGWLDASDE